MIKIINNNFNNIVRSYLAISIFAYLIYLIAPLVSLIMNTQVYSFQRYLALLGMGIIAYDLLFFRIGFKSKYSFLLYPIVVLAGIASLTTINYGIKENLFDIIWLGIYIYIYYSYAERVGQEQVKRDLDKMYKYISIIWLVAILLSISTYLFNTGYRILANPYNDYLTRQGFMENRLFGVFMTLIMSAIVSGMLIIYGSIRYPKKKRVIFINFIFFIHIILSGSRGALLSLIAVLLVVSFYKGYTKYFINKTAIMKTSMSVLLALGLGGGLFVGGQILKEGLAYLPSFTIFKDNSMEYKKLLSKYPNIVVEGLEEAGLENLDEDINVEEILERQDVDESNVSNGRLSIWMDYIGMYKDVSIFGLSPSNYSKYIHEHHHDLFIVQFIKENHPHTYAVGGVYHPHNTYLMTYVATGVFGLLTFLVTLFLLAKDTIVRLFKKEDSYLLLISSIVLFCLVNGLFDSILLFSNEVVTAMFWVFLGVLAHILKNKEVK